MIRVLMRLLINFKLHTYLISRKSRLSRFKLVIKYKRVIVIINKKQRRLISIISLKRITLLLKYKIK